MNMALIQDSLSDIETLNRKILNEFESNNINSEDYKKFKEYANFIKNFMLC